MAAVRKSAAAVWLHVGPPWEAAAVHGWRVRAEARVDARREPRVARAPVPAARRRAALAGRSQSPVPQLACAALARLLARRLRVDRLQRRRHERAVVLTPRARARR